MTPLEVFARLPANMLRQWLEAERDDAHRFLSQGGDMLTLYRAQGKVQFVEKMLDLLDKAQNLR